MQYRSDLVFINPLDIRDKNGNIQLSFPTPVANADNYLSVLNGYSGAGTEVDKGVGFKADGTGNVNIYFTPKANGYLKVYNNSNTEEYHRRIADDVFALATVGYVERAITIGVIYLQPVVAVFNNIASALPSGASVTIDGKLITSGERVLVKASNDTYNEWIVEYDGSGWTKVEDFIEESEDGTVHYRVGATTFVDNDGTTPTYKDVRFTWNGEEWVLQSNDAAITYTATEGVKLVSTQFSMDIPGLTELITPEGDADYIAIYDNSAGVHKKVLVDTLIPDPATYSWEVGADNSTDNQVSSGHDVHLLGDTDNWVDTVYTYESGTHTIKFQYGLAGLHHRVLMTDATGSPIERAGTARHILRPYASEWDTGVTGEFVESTTLALGDTSGVGRIALHTTEATTHYVGFKAPTTAADQMYTLPQAYPSVNTYVLASTTTGTLSWVARTENTDELVAAASGATAGYLIDVLQGVTDGTPVSGIKVSQYDTNYVLLQGTVSDVASKTAVATDVLAIYGTTGDELIANKSTVLDISSVYLVNNFDGSNYYNGSIGIVQLADTDFTLVSNEYVATINISTAFSIASYNSNVLLPIVQYRKSQTPDVWETIMCDTRVSADEIKVAFANDPATGTVFRVTVIFDPRQTS